MSDVPKIFITYSWDNEQHKEWVRKFSDRLLSDGVDVTVDQYDVSSGDRLPQFMEQSIAAADFVLIICTPLYKQKADRRMGGAGYEGHIISDELFQKHNERKFIPVIRKGDHLTAMPTFCAGKFAIDLSDEPFSELEYSKLLETIFGKKRKPPVGKKPASVGNFYRSGDENSPIRIVKIIEDGITTPRMDGTRGSALYAIPFQLSRTPSSEWIKFFLEEWEEPPRFTSMHRPGIASVIGNRIILDGTTIDEVKEFHRDTLKLCVNEANKRELRYIALKQQERERKAQQKAEHMNHVSSVIDEIEF